MSGKVTKREVDACNFCSWYQTFRVHTIRSIIIPLPQDFVSYILEDGIVLPSSHKTVDTISDDEDEIFDVKLSTSRKIETNIQSDESFDDNIKIGCSSSSSDINSVVAETREFPELERDVLKAIDDLNGDVFVKMNWSAPIDASWISVNALKCNSFHDILLLLKSSDRVLYDIEHIYDECIDHNDQGKSLTDIPPEGEKMDSSVDEIRLRGNINRSLILRKWTSINQSYEFRVFMKNSKLRGV